MDNISINAQIQIALLNAGIYPGFVGALENILKNHVEHIERLQKRIEKLEMANGSDN